MNAQGKNSTHKDQIAAIREAKTAAATLIDTERSLREEHAGIVKERKRVFHANLSEDEILANLNRLVDEAGASWASDNATYVIREASGYTDYRGTGSEQREINVRPRLPHFENRPMTFQELCGAFPEQAKARLTQVIKQSQQPFGLSAPARLARLAELDAQITELEAVHTELVDSAGDVGIVLALLPSVKARREGEALARERAAELERERAQGIYRVSA